MRKKLKKIFQPKSPIYSLALGLMSFFAILISLMTLQEMKAQRELGLMPIIYFNNFGNKFLHVDSCGNQIFNEKIIEQDLEGQLFEDQTIDKMFALNMINVGEGSAVDINIEWDINFDWFQNHFDSLEIDREIFRLKTEPEEVVYYYFQCPSIKAASAKDRKLNTEYSHLLSASVHKDGLQMKIPESILRLQTAYIKALWIKNGQTIKNVDPLSVEHDFSLTYHSVNGNSYKNKYKMAITLSIPRVSYRENNFDVYAPWTDFYLEVNLEKIE